jgi:hypothetical protein
MDISHPFWRGGDTCVMASIAVTEVSTELDGEIRRNISSAYHKAKKVKNMLTLVTKVPYYYIY